MIEKIVENWLTKVNERQYQFPFCQLLLSKGYRVLHLSSHGPQEQGKDIIAIDPSGQPTAFQLKTGDIDLAGLRKIQGELVELVEVPIQFPGIDRQHRHRSVLVTSGMLNDTARQTLDGYIRGWRARRFPTLRIEVRDSLIKDFVDLHGRYLPTQLADVEQLLRLYTCDGVAPLPRKQFADFVAANVPIGDLPKRFIRRESGRKIKRSKPTRKDIERHLASAALLVSYALYSFTTRKNHWAEFEGWVIFGAHILAVAERFKLQDPVWLPTFELSFLAARTALTALIQEAVGRDQWYEGNVLVDSAVYRARMTITLGLMALYALICQLRNEPNPLENDIARFVDSHRQGLYLWGETAVPYLLLLAFYVESRVSAVAAESILGAVLSNLVQKNRPRSEGVLDASLSDPYLEIDEALAWNCGLRREPEWERPNYAGQAYSLRTLVMLLTKRLRRQLLARNWYGITEVNYTEMYPSPSWAMLLWRAAHGDLRVELARRPQSWAGLLEEARTLATDKVPLRLRARPDFLAAFITVFPHRLRADTLKLIDDSR